MNDTKSSLNGLTNSIINGSLVTHRSVSTSTEKYNIRHTYGRIKPIVTEMSEDYANYLSPKYMNKSPIDKNIKFTVNNVKEKIHPYKKKVYKNLNKKKIISGSEQLYKSDKEVFNSIKYAHIYYQNNRKDMMGNKEINNNCFKKVNEKFKNTFPKYRKLKNLSPLVINTSQIDKNLKDSNRNIIPYKINKKSNMSTIKKVREIFNNTENSNNELLFSSRVIEVTNFYN